LDLGDEEEMGITVHSIIEGREYPNYVSSSDKNGNEVAGVRLPDITVPVVTHTG